MTPERARVSTLALPLLGAPPVPTVPRPDRFTLANGLRVLAVPRADLPKVAVRLALPAGSSADPNDAPGAAALVGSLLTEGTDLQSAVDLNDRIDSLGASLGARVGHDFAEIDLSLLAETLESGLALLGEVVAMPAFPEREVERVRLETLDALEARLDEPANIADDHAATALFGVSHPYGRLPIGTAQSVASIRREDLVAFHRSRYRPGGAVLIVAGDFDARLISRQLEAAFAGWTGRIDAVRYDAPPAEPVAAGDLARIYLEGAAQGEIRLAGVGIPRHSPDWVAASVANYILGGSTITGRLGANLREDKGWTYGVRSSFAAGVQPAGWGVDTAVDAEVIDEAIVEITAELDRMVAEPVTEEELARAKEAMILSLPRAFETVDRIVSRLATVEVFGLEKDYWQTFPDRVARVTAEQVQDIARRCFEPSKLVRITVGPPDGR